MAKVIEVLYYKLDPHILTVLYGGIELQIGNIEKFEWTKGEGAKFRKCCKLDITHISLQIEIGWYSTVIMTSNTSLEAPGPITHHLQRHTARKIQNGR